MAKNPDWQDILKTPSDKPDDIIRKTLKGSDEPDDPNWDNDSKTWSADRPFHRVGSPSFDATRSPVDGLGYNCGCRRMPDPDPDPPFFGWQAPDKEIWRMIPNWVSVESAGTQGESEKELEGVLRESFQSWTDTPMLQWHQWYDWNFHVWPAPGYKYLRGLGNRSVQEIKHEVETPFGIEYSPTARELVYRTFAMECEWDTGAFGKSRSQPYGPGPMFGYSGTEWGFPDEDKDDPETYTAGRPVSVSAPLVDWAWPMAKQYIWLAGRWIYDCSHADDNDRMRTELHPCKAVATARWEAVQFDLATAGFEMVWPYKIRQEAPSTDKTLFLPAVQFMFFASRLGGYHDFPNINDRNYKFIVDLPKITPAAVAADVEHGPPVPVNILSLPAWLLIKKREFSDFQTQAAGTFNFVEPVVTPIPNTVAGKPPEQVYIELPLTKLPAGTDSYGVIVSLGWLDSNQTMAKRVAKCSLTFDNLTVVDGRTPTGRLSADWDFKFGVNGRWFHRQFSRVTPGKIIPLAMTVEFALSLDHPTPGGAAVSVNAHGTSINLVGDFMAGAHGNRTLHFYKASKLGLNTSLDPSTLVELPDIVRFKEDVVEGEPAKTAAVAHAIEVKLASTLDLENFRLEGSDVQVLITGAIAKPVLLRTRDFVLQCSLAVEMQQVP